MTAPQAGGRRAGTVPALVGVDRLSGVESGAAPSPPAAIPFARTVQRADRDPETEAVSTVVFMCSGVA